jgi:hypothetical protein
MLYLSVDIEGSGDRLSNQIMAIGTCFGDSVGHVIEKKTWCLDMTGKKIDPTTFDEFWSKNLALLKKIRAEIVPYKEGMESFIDYLYELDKKYPDDKIHIVSDNPSYDVTMVSHAMHENFPNEFPLRYSRSGQYRRVDDPSQRLHAYGDIIKKAVQNIASRMCVHDHWPSNDAENIYWTLILTNSLKKYGTVKEGVDVFANLLNDEKLDDKLKEAIKKEFS